MHHANIQGIVIYSYALSTNARYLHVSLPDGAPARTWLAGLSGEVSSSATFRDMPREARPRAIFTNVAFTPTGLARLGVEPEELSGFAREFQQGMAHPERSRVLGDVNDDAPEAWELGGPKNGRIDALLMLFGNDDVLEAAVERQRARARASGVEIVAEQTAWLDDLGREHFGFADGIAQPHVKGSGRAPGLGQHTLATGELLLGHPNAYDVVPPTPTGRARPASRLPPNAEGQVDLGRDGTYLVYRKLEQDVHAFWNSACAHAGPGGASTRRHAAIAAAASMVGRWPSGAPLVKRPTADDPKLGRSDDFGYEHDPRGLACPIGSHVRRANPRDSLEPSPSESTAMTMAHRIVRRGRPYGERLFDPRHLEDSVELPPGARAEGERGLIFLALNASIRRQFEFIQQTWINSPTFARLDGERDPLIGGDFRDGTNRFTVPKQPVRQRMNALPHFVKLRGGGYFFVPSLAVLAHLST